MEGAMFKALRNVGYDEETAHYFRLFDSDRAVANMSALPEWDSSDSQAFWTPLAEDSVYSGTASASQRFDPNTMRLASSAELVG
jgi:hypothetical protein